MQLNHPAAALLPSRDETYEHFVVRAHRQLMDVMPDPDERNELVWANWERARGLTEEQQRAAKVFGDPSRYQPHRNVCVFAEHSAVDGQGQPRTYDLAAMVRICRTNNHRINDFDGFSPIADGHTPNPEDPVQQEPEILGYAGPYRLGMIGRKEPRWAVFCDEWHSSHAVDRLRAKPRRSVELWTFANDPKRMHFDPIAAIGSETPRLNLPVKFRRDQRDGVLVERYTFAAPSMASPGAGNTFLKGNDVKGQYVRDPQSFDDKQNARRDAINSKVPGLGNALVPRPLYAATEGPVAQEGNSMALSNEDIGQIMQAITSTPQFQFLEQLMAKEQGAGEQPGAEPDGDEAPPPDAMPPAEDDLGDMNDLMVGDEGGEGGEMPPEAPAEGQEPEEKNGRAGELAGQIGGSAIGAGPGAKLGGFIGNKLDPFSQKAAGNIATKYSQLRTAHNSLVQEHGRLNQQVTALQRRATDADRAATIQALARKFPDFVDVNDEMGNCLYSRNANMSDEAFTKHIASVEKYAQRAAMAARTTGDTIPAGRMPREIPDAQREQYSQRLTSEAVKIHTRAINAGKDGYTWEMAKEEARKVLGG